MLQKAAPITTPAIPYNERVKMYEEQQKNSGMNNQVLLFVGIAVVGYLLLVPSKKKSKSNGGLNGAKPKKRKGTKSRKAANK